MICKRHISCYGSGLVLYLLLLVCLPSLAQNYPQNYFRYPLDSLPNFVSPFGGLRDNHFHSGVDLRTNGREGMAVYAAANGYISRIKVQKNGYGKALYIEHDNGYVTVYGHLQSYYGPVADWIRRYQYINKTFEFDKIFIKPFLYVKKGDTIGLSGNSGGSTGPHLHFEIRDLKTEKTMNPSLFGILPIDSLPPVIWKINVYKFVAEGLVLKKQLLPDKKNSIYDGNNIRWKDTLVLSNETFGFAIETYDYIHNAKDEKGIYEYTFQVNEKVLFTHRLNQFAFDETKYINAHIDYPFYKLQKTRLQKCFIDDGNKFKSYTTDKSKGRFSPAAAETGTLWFLVKDNNGNACSLQIPYKTVEATADIEILKYLKSVQGKPVLLPLQKNKVKAPGLEIILDPGCIYDTIYYTLETEPATVETFSEVYKFHHPNTPVHDAFDIAIKPVAVPPGLQNKLILAYSHPASEALRSSGGKYQDGWVRGKGTSFGNYTVVVDTVAPRIKTSRYKNEYDPSDTLRWDFDIRDNFSGIAKYEAYLNNNWILMDYDPKNSLLSYHFDEVYYLLKEKQTEEFKLHPEFVPVTEIRIRVEDAKGNIAEETFSVDMGLQK